MIQRPTPSVRTVTHIAAMMIFDLKGFFKPVDHQRPESPRPHEPDPLDREKKDSIMAVMDCIRGRFSKGLREMHVPRDDGQKTEQMTAEHRPKGEGSA